MRGRKEEIGIQKHIRIVDSDVKDMLNRIVELPKYKSFNQAINDALFYGVPVLFEKLFGEVKDDVQVESTPFQESVKEENVSDEFYLQVVRLLKEIVLTNSINKSMLSSIFNACTKGYKGENISGKRFEDGEYATTPDYLELYEIRGLKNIRSDKK